MTFWLLKSVVNCGFVAHKLCHNIEESDEKGKRKQPSLIVSPPVAFLSILFFILNFFDSGTRSSVSSRSVSKNFISHNGQLDTLPVISHNSLFNWRPVSQISPFNSQVEKSDFCETCSAVEEVN